ncbi:hypothetical protein X801_04811 [Opisthorchis viverrini]|uniref:Uncharacterized protein n=1 Tax=Opisthorchis viverrini TaxID=6198 RepID=A0A1S8WY55_OPIVI|nr:hypothetical protein X801_04811 [Opisthorchis viverrini]
MSSHAASATLYGLTLNLRQAEQTGSRPRSSSSGLQWQIHCIPLPFRSFNLDRRYHTSLPFQFHTPKSSPVRQYKSRDLTGVRQSASPPYCEPVLINVGISASRFGVQGPQLLERVV